MDARGVEPRNIRCKRDGLPLAYRPGFYIILRKNVFLKLPKTSEYSIKNYTKANKLKLTG